MNVAKQEGIRRRSISLEEVLNRLRPARDLMALLVAVYDEFDRQRTRNRPSVEEPTI